jgi:hypothetical protein
MYTKKFPSRDCEIFANCYPGAFFEKYAIADYDYISANKNEQSSGVLQCFCQD